MRFNDDHNRWTPEGQSYDQSEARKEEGCSPVIADDLITRVIVGMALKLRWEHVTDRKWAAWYTGGIETMQEIAK